MISKSPIEIIANFLNDAAKIVFASIVVGFFVSSEISLPIFFGGMSVTVVFLIFTIIISKLNKRIYD
ncbi:hypothetical protein KKC83_01460 [Patescibacteria group bacterium]|nr:hypothetical protein [Candidatus Falkowbacteria bacterium]MBU3906048.1 hypothetical protein [Patescibacteria group bacterium]MBU4015077.1 hypothetical protein [Patescibacteria group bacterium]MBU4026193.1 hypothetical protein [Patescibacteria group bacterium]MBU4073697.1 hypothetical protein [Patescibacteria group bacterium]